MNPALLTCTFGLVLNPMLWRCGLAADRVGTTIMWHLFLGPIMLTLGAEEAA